MVRTSLMSAALRLGIAVGALSACTAGPGGDEAAPTTSAAPSTTAPAPAPLDPGDVPTAAGPDLDAAVAAIGAEQVGAAVRIAAQVAHIALADCHRWTTGQVDPRLIDLLTPEMLARALDELERAEEYASGRVPSLLSHLPTDDGNGNDQAALVRDGCDDSAPLRFPHGPMHVSVAHGGDAPRLRIDCACGTTVTFGTTPVGAAQDWVFTMEQGPDGWRLSDVDAVVANVNWHPAPEA